MATVTSEIQIVNSALNKLGAELISSFNDQTKQARIAKTQYPILRDEVLRSHPWNFAIKKAELAVLNETPVFEYTVASQIPGDSLRILNVNIANYEFAIEGRKLYSNFSPVQIRYIYRNETVAEYDANFVEALAYRIAADMAYPLVQSRQLSQDMMSAYEMFVSRARSFDSQEGSPESLEADTWIRSRTIGTIIGSGQL